MSRPSFSERWRRRTRWSVRTRVLTALVALSALALLVAGTTAYVLERGRVDERIEASLSHTESDFQAFAATGTDPDTGAAFTDLRRLLYAGMGRIVPEPNEGMLGIIGDKVALHAASQYPLQLQEDPELVAAVIPLTLGSESMLTSVDTSITSYRVLVVPISMPDGTTGGLVLAYDRLAEHDELAVTYRTYALVAIGAVALIGAIGFMIVSDLLRPVSILRDAVEKISSADLSRRIAVVGNDDLAVLTMNVNTMLDRLDHAFAAQRELLDDVGHELRTPLTVVRGHLELMDAADPADAAAARTIALDELDRMNALVEELITLAKARRPDFVTPVPTDVAVLTDDVLTKAHPLGERRWSLDELAEVVVDLDPHRVTQAWLQLASNAVKFSEPGAVVALGSAADSRELRIWVRDEGSGIAADDQERIFERFERADTGPAEGSGLGLTIVRSIAAAHGGDVRLQSALGAGSTFTIALPRQRQDAATDIHEEDR